MSFPSPAEDEAERVSRDVPKVRSCLRCRTTFPSASAGERICPRCKGTAAWRQGAPAQSRARGPQK